MSASLLSRITNLSYQAVDLVPVWTPLTTLLRVQSNVFWNQGFCEATTMGVGPGLITLVASEAIPRAVCLAQEGTFTFPNNYFSKNWAFPTCLATSGLMNVFAYYVYHGSFFPQAQYTGLALQVMSISPLSTSIQAARYKMLRHLSIKDQNQCDKICLLSNIAAIFSSLIASRVMSRSSLDPILSTGVSIGTSFAVSLISFPIFASIFKSLESKETVA